MVDQPVDRFQNAEHQVKKRKLEGSVGRRSGGIGGKIRSRQWNVAGKQKKLLIEGSLGHIW